MRLAQVMADMPSKSCLRWAKVASMAAVAVFGTLLAVDSGMPLTKTGSDVIFEVDAPVAGCACFRAARRREADARVWRLLGVAALIWAIADAMWAVHAVTRHYLYPFPSVADLSRLGYSVPVVVGLLSFPGNHGGAF